MREDVLGIGIDLVEVRRFAASLERFGERLKRRLFTELERRYCDGYAASTRAEHYAARFAAKEAWIKASGIGIAWRELEVVNQPGTGVPELTLSGRTRLAARRAGIARILLTLTHAGGLSAAHVVLLGRARPRRERTG